ncbi:MAG: hypothetical protein JW941_00945 [Candidatus Coatesbacteria bacterium]|nr:hypothetical protein [Candidatus Coatesbacteria bacterium]
MPIVTILKAARCTIPVLVFLFVGFAYPNEWHNFTAPGWANVDIAKMGPNGTLWLHGGSSGMSGLLEASVHDDLLSFRHLSPYNSLCVPDAIYDIVPTFDGLWLATNNGLQMYKGIYSRTYTPENSPLPVRNIVKLCPGADGGLWIGTDEAICLFQDGLWLTFTTKSTILPGGGGWLDSMTFDTRAGLLACSFRERESTGAYSALYILQVDNGQWTRFGTDNSGMVPNYVSDMLFDDDGVLWMSHGTGILSFDGTTWTDYTGENSGVPVTTSTYVIKLALSPDGELYSLCRGTSGCICRFTGGDWVVVPVNSPYFNTCFDNMLFDPEGHLWVFTDAEFIRLGPDGPEHYGLPQNGLIDSDMYGKIVAGRSDAIWFLGASTGICRYQDGNWDNWTPQNSDIAASYVRDIAEGPDGSLWVLSAYPVYSIMIPEQLVLQRFDGVQWANFSNGVGYFAPEMTDGAYGHVIVDDSHNVYVGPKGSILKFDWEFWREIPLPDGDEYSTIFSLAIDEESDTLAVGLFGSVALLDENEEWSVIELDHNDKVVSLAFDHDGKLWGAIVNNTGVPHNAFSYDGAITAIYNTESTGVIMDFTYCVAVDAYNTKWFGRYRDMVMTRGGALSFDGSNWRSWTSGTSGLFQANDEKDVSVCSIACALNGDVWFGSYGFGVSRLSNQGQPDPLPTVEIVLDRVQYQTGDMLTASLVESNLGSERRDVNVIIALQLPDGSILYFPEWSASMIVFMPQLLLPGTQTQPMKFFEQPIAEWLPRGEYCWYAALSDDMALLGNISAAPFTLN